VAPAPAAPAAPQPPQGVTNPKAGADGTVLSPTDATLNKFTTALNATLGSNGETRAGVKALDKVDLFNILCVPGLSDGQTITGLQKYCYDHRAFYVVDCAETSTPPDLLGLATAAGADPPSRNSALYFPWLTAADPKQDGRTRNFPPSGAVAGIYARTDTNRGVWKAPAGVEAGLTGVAGLNVLLSDLQNGTLNVKGINCLRSFPVYGNLVWGARTLAGSDDLASEYKYVSVRRLTLYIEESLYRGTKWVVFEPNDEPLWAQIRLNVGAFMDTLFRQRAFQGTSANEAYVVRCDSTTTTQNDINRGVVNIVVGFAPVKPAEFVVIQIQQLAGQVGP
jgi:phage tail sheath protein FI